MRFLNFKPTWSGDIEILSLHLSEDPGEKKKHFFDRRSYEVTTIIDPVTMRIVANKCECFDFMNTRAQASACKHIREEVALLSALGVLYKDGHN